MEPPIVFRCSTCEEDKAESCFYPSSLVRKSRQCKGCKNAYYRRDRKRFRRLALEHYAGSSEPFCACCKETIYPFLTLDHHPRVDRMDDIMNKDFWRWLHKQGYPAGYRVLCFNCNSGRALFVDGICPHERNIT